MTKSVPTLAIGALLLLAALPYPPTSRKRKVTVKSGQTTDVTFTCKHGKG